MTQISTDDAGFSPLAEEEAVITKTNFSSPSDDLSTQSSDLDIASGISFERETSKNMICVPAGETTNQCLRLPTDEVKQQAHSSIQRLVKLIPRKSLVVIDLSQRGITAMDAQVLHTALLCNPNLSTLKLGYNNLRDSGCVTIAPAIRSHPSLAVFDVGFNSIGDIGCEAISRSITGNNVLETLYLSGNAVGEGGALALANAIQLGCGLTCIHLTANKIGSNGMLILMKAIALDEMKRQEMIWLREQRSRKGDIKSSMSLSKHKMLTHVSNCNRDVSMSDGSNLITIEGFGNRNDNSSIKKQTIRELFLGGTAMRPEGCISVSNMLLTNFSVRVLSLSDNGLTDRDLALLAQSLSRNKLVPLEVLQLSFNNLTCAGVESLMNAIWGSKTLREIRLDNNRIRDRGAQLAAVVLTSVPLQVLDLGFNLITTTGIKALMKTLAENVSLVSLTLSGNPLDTNTSKAVSYALAFNKSLKELFMDHCSVGYVAQRHIAAGIVSNRNVAIKVLTGFPLGAITVTLGFPSALEQWNNDQVLKFIRFMWEQNNRLEEGTSKDQHVTEKSTLHNNVNVPDEENDVACADGVTLRSTSAVENENTNKGVCDPATVVAVAKSAFESLGETPDDALQSFEAVDTPSQCPLVSHEILETSPSGILRVPSLNDMEKNLLCSNGSDDLGANLSHSRLCVPRKIDLGRQRMKMEWLNEHACSLDQLTKEPFNNADLWKLHRHFFSPVDSAASHSLKDNGCDGPHMQDNERNEGQISIDDCGVESLGCTNGRSLPKLGRKLSYRILSEALLNASSYEDNTKVKLVNPITNVVGRRRCASLLNDNSLSGKCSQPATKRARSSKSRIDFFPRIKAKLEDLKSNASQHKALVLMRQLEFVERRMFQRRDIYSDSKDIEDTHVFLVSDAEAILIDMR